MKKITKGPNWELFTGPTRVIPEEIAQKAWTDAFKQFMSDLEQSGRDLFEREPIPTESLLRKTEI